MDLLAAGQVKPEDIHDYIEAWHTGEADREGIYGSMLHWYLGMTWQEYAWWLQGQTLMGILESRKNKGL